MALGGPLIALAAHRLRLDVVHDPIGVSPFMLGRWAGQFRRLTTIHDAIAFRYPEGYPWLNNLLHRRYVPASLPNLDGVVAVSEDAARDLARFMGVPPARIHVVPSGVSAHFRPVPPDAAAAVAQRYGLTGPYILSVGAQKAHKNVARLVAAFAQVRDAFPDVRLAIAGPTQWRHSGVEDEIARQGVASAVARLGYVAEDDLPALYSAARLFALPSLYEGFGLPVLEAMACGAPVVCSNTTALPEVAGDAALLVDPTDVDALAAALRRLLADDGLRCDLAARGLARARQFTWEQTARNMVRVYRAVLGWEQGGN